MITKEILENAIYNDQEELYKILKAYYLGGEYIKNKGSIDEGTHTIIKIQRAYAKDIFGKYCTVFRDSNNFQSLVPS